MKLVTRTSVLDSPGEDVVPDGTLDRVADEDPPGDLTGPE